MHPAEHVCRLVGLDGSENFSSIYKFRIDGHFVVALLVSSAVRDFKMFVLSASSREANRGCFPLGSSTSSSLGPRSNVAIGASISDFRKPTGMKTRCFFCVRLGFRERRPAVLHASFQVVAFSEKV